VLADVAYTQNCVDQHAVVSMCLNAGGAASAGCGIGDADSYHRGRLRCRSQPARRGLRRQRRRHGARDAAGACGIR
jgi:hypothetical protein